MKKKMGVVHTFVKSSALFSQKKMGVVHTFVNQVLCFP